MTKRTHRVIAALNMPLSVPAFIKGSRAVVTAMANNPYFPSPNPPLPTVTKSIDQLDAAEQLAATRAKGAVEARDAARANVVSNLHDLRQYVQSRADADPANAEKIITSAGMSVKRSPARTKSDFEAKAGPVSGSVHLVVRAPARRASYEWQWSIDGGKTWQQAPGTLQAKTTIAGLPMGVVCEFRFRSITKGGEGDWSQVIQFLVK